MRNYSKIFTTVSSYFLIFSILVQLFKDPVHCFHDIGKYPTRFEDIGRLNRLPAICDLPYAEKYINKYLPDVDVIEPIFIREFEPPVKVTEKPKYMKQLLHGPLHENEYIMDWQKFPDFSEHQIPADFMNHFGNPRANIWRTNSINEYSKFLPMELQKIRNFKKNSRAKKPKSYPVKSDIYFRPRNLKKQILVIKNLTDVDKILRNKFVVPLRSRNKFYDVDSSRGFGDEEIEKKKLYAIRQRRYVRDEERKRFIVSKRFLNSRNWRKARRIILRQNEVNQEIEPYNMMDTLGLILEARRRGRRGDEKELSISELPPDINCKSMRRIMGGMTVTTPELIPYIVFVDTGCSGAIIHEKWVLTAGHCIDDRGPTYVHVGSVSLLNGCQYNVVYVYVHPEFDSRAPEYDVGLLKIAPSFVYSQAIKPIMLSHTRARVNTCGVVAGWGATKFRGGPSFKLKLAMIPVVDRKHCREYDIHRGQFCAGHSDGKRDACQGDSGGPFVVDGVVIGIVSYGYQCGHPDYPGVYVDVSYHRDWINLVTGI